MMNRRSAQEKKEASANDKPSNTAIRKQYSKRNSLNRTIPKVGMIGSLGALIVSGLMHFKGAKSLHVWSGFALVGFSMWHHMQNRPRTKKT